jgi:tRNA-modifying protein YgfZ
MTLVAISPMYQAAREHAGLITRERGLILVSGKDRASYLQGLFTNDIAALQAGQGCYAAYLTAQGRMISDVWVYELGDVILLALPRATKDVVLARLDQFIFSEDVQLGDVSDTLAAVAVVGPDATRLVSQVVGTAAAGLANLPEHGNMRLGVDGQPVIVLRISDAGEAGLELVAACEQMPALVQALRGAGALDVDAATAAALRIEAGVPLFGPDMDEHTIPLEAGIEARAISFTKGCYVGQEVIIRVLHRGHGRVARKLVGLVFDAQQGAPVPGTVLNADAKQVGVVTSSAVSPALGRPIALGYVKRELAEPGTMVQTPEGMVAHVASLPFQRP